MSKETEPNQKIDTEIINNDSTLCQEEVCAIETKKGEILCVGVVKSFYFCKINLNK